MRRTSTAIITLIMLGAILILSIRVYRASNGRVEPVDKSQESVTAPQELTDREFLQILLKNTWSCLDAMIDESTGFPRDTHKPGGMTNTTNIGLYLASLCTARGIGLIDSDFGFARANEILASLETFERVKGFMPNFIPVDLSDRTSHGEMAVSDFNKLAVGLIMVRQTWPELSGRISAFLDEIDWSLLYNAETGLTYWGFDLDESRPIGAGNLMLTADTRLATFMLIATEAAPPAVWDHLKRNAMDTEVGRIFAPGYEFGGLFMHAMDGIFIPEHDTEVGESVGNLAWHQIRFAQRKGYPLWGWSNCYVPGSGYTEGGYLLEHVVTPHAAALVIEYYPTHATAALREMVRRGGTEDRQWGLRDSYDMMNGRWDNRYLSLDQGMLFLSLANHMHDGVVREIYTADPLIQEGLTLLEPHIHHNMELLQRWQERDHRPIHTPEPQKKAGKRSVVEIPLNRYGSSVPDALKLSDAGAGGVTIDLDTQGKEDEFLATFATAPVDISKLDRIEIDMEVKDTAANPAGCLRLLVADRFGQRRYVHLELDREKKTYSIPATDLRGILLDEKSAIRLQLSFWRSPWFFTDRNLKTDRCRLHVSAIRFVSQ